MKPQDSHIHQYIQTNCYKYKKEEFTLSSGKKSKHYFDLKQILLNPEMLKDICHTIIFKIEALDKLMGTKINTIGGLTLGADPLTYGVTLYSQIQNKQPLKPLVVRKEAKSHGAQSLVEGLMDYGTLQCLVVDDVVTTGGSTIKAIDALRNIGVEVVAALCILDREEGGKEAIGAKGINLYSLYKKSDFGIGE